MKRYLFIALVAAALFGAFATLDPRRTQAVTVVTYTFTITGTYQSDNAEQASAMLKNICDNVTGLRLGVELSSVSCTQATPTPSPSPSPTATPTATPT